MRIKNGDGWASRYREMSRMLYQVRRLAPHLGILGISTLHPRYPIPADQMELMKLLDKMDQKTAKARMPSFLSLWVGGSISLLYAVRESLNIAHLRLRFAPALRRLKKEPIDLLIKSWCFGIEPSDGSGDFYYGTLGEDLQKKGIRPLFLCGDARGRMTKELARHLFEKRPVRAVPEAVLVPMWAPFVAVWGQLRGVLRIRRLGLRSGDARFAAVCAAVSSYGMNPATLRHSLYFYIAREAVKAWKPRALVTLYEGQPWEKLAWHGARAADPRCRIIGYQHTVVMPQSLSLLSPNQGSWELSAPDAVLCLGEVTRKMMEEGHRPFGSRLIRFGSFRRTNGSAGGHPPQPERRTVLVLPVGVLDEAVLLFNFAIKLAESCPGYRFIFRCHPVLPFDRVRPHLTGSLERLSNIEISKEGVISSDFGRSSTVLYHGSSAVLYAVLDGLKPLYLHFEQLPDTDPLFQMSEWKEPVFSAEGAARALEIYGSVSAAEAARQWRGAFDYVQGYAPSVDESSVGSLLDLIGSREDAG